MDTDFAEQVRAKLEARRGDWKRIAKAADVSHSWVSQFVRQKIPNPGYRTLQRIYSELIGQPDAPATAPSSAPTRAEAA